MKPNDHQTKYIWAVALVVSLCVAILVSLNEASKANDSFQYMLGLLTGALILPILVSAIIVGTAWILAIAISSRRIPFASWLNIWALATLALVVFLSIIGPYWLKPHIDSIAAESHTAPIAHGSQATIDEAKSSIPPNNSLSPAASNTSQQTAEQALREAQEAATAAQEAADYVPTSPSDAAQRLLTDLLECQTSPQTGAAIRSMYEAGYLFRTNDSSEGIPVFMFRIPVNIFGQEVTYIAGWQQEPDGSTAEPFKPMLNARAHIAASFNAPREALRYSSLRNPAPYGSHSEVILGQLDGSTAGSTITCYAN